MSKQYDVFISYRRLGGSEYARTIQQALEKQYNVFLDFDELKDGVFDQRIIDAIGNSSVFLLILSKGALDRCVDENDWVRQEIIHASKSRCHIVPVTIDDTFGGIPSNIPDEIRNIVSIHQFSELQMKTLFKPSMEQLIRDRIDPYVSKHSKDNLGTEIHIESDCDCEMFQFKEFLGTLYADDDFVIYLKPGKYRLSFISCLYPDIKLSMTYSLEDGKYYDIIDVPLKDKINERRKKEEEEKEKIRQSVREISKKAQDYYNNNEYDEAYSLFQEAANKGDDVAQYYLGVFFELGLSVKPDIKEALKWYEKAADAGNVEAIQYFSSQADKGNYTNEENLLRWLTDASSKKIAWATFKLAVMYYLGKGCEINAEKALDCFYTSAELGNVDAQYMLGKIYEEGNIVAIDYTESYKWYHRAADGKKMEAEYALGYFYEHGKGISVNFEKASKWYSLSSEQGYSLAKFNLGRLYEKGIGIKQDINKAISLYLESDIDSARLQLGFLYENGLGVPKDTATATSLYESGMADINYFKNIASEDGNPIAKNVIGDSFFADANYSEALMWYLKSANLGYERAMFNVGYIYENGKGVKEDYNEAVLWYRKAAEKGLGDAQDAIGYMYEYGLGLPIDYNRAAKWYKKSAKQSNTNSLLGLSRLYVKGRGVPQNLHEAARWYSKALESLDDNSITVELDMEGLRTNAELLFWIGESYYYGDGINKNYPKAFHWYKKASDLGYSDAQFSLGIMLENGEGVEEDYKEAVKYYYLSAKQHNSNALEAINNLGDQEVIDALYYLGELFFYGKGVRQDYSEAIKWYKKAADLGHLEAICKLGEIYEKGKGVQQNFSKAAAYYRKAVELGNGVALKKLQELADNKKNIDAQYNLGEMYFYASGVDMDYDEAIRWFKMAAKQGYKPAISVLNEMVNDKSYGL